MTRLDDMAGSAPGKATAGLPNIPESQPKEITPAQAALRSITIGDLISFQLKLLIASIAVALPLAVILFFIAIVLGWFR